MSKSNLFHLFASLFYSQSYISIAFNALNRKTFSCVNSKTLYLFVQRYMQIETIATTAIITIKDPLALIMRKY